MGVLTAELVQKWLEFKIFNVTEDRDIEVITFKSRQMSVSA